MTSKSTLIERVLQITFSSERRMPAHFTSSGDRTQSFCVDFPQLTAEDEYEMASEAYTSVSTFTGRLDMEIDPLDQSLILKIGEDVMLASFVFTAFSGQTETSLIEKVKKENLSMMSEAWEGREVFTLLLQNKHVKSYLCHCFNVGRDRAALSKVRT